MVDTLIPLESSSLDQQIERQRLTSLINSMADAVIAIDEHHTVALYNAAALNILDLNTIDEGKKLESFFHPIDKNNQPYSISNLIAQTTTPVTNRDLRLPYQDGSTINIYLSIAPVHLGYGEEGMKGFVILLRDITREKSLEEERDEFISVVSHELRTPIAISEGNISNAEFIAAKTGDIKTIQQALKEAHNQVLFLSDMINDLSTLSRAERGTLEVTVEEIPVAELMQELMKNYMPEAEKKHLELKLELPPSLRPLHSSKLYTREILQNFITNSIKYTDAGSVTLRAANTEKGTKFEVQDTGIGISKSDQDRVFDKFFRSEDYRTRKSNGTGLGLYVTMKLTRLLHADVQLESQLNRGSSFTITIPDLA